jgi:hypothetical protein
VIDVFDVYDEGIDLDLSSDNQEKNINITTKN